MLYRAASILSEAFSHDPFERRVKVTYAFTKELLSLVAERGKALTTRTRAAPGATRDSLALRSALPATATSQPVTFEVLTRTGDSLRTQPGVPRGLRRTGELRTRMMPVFDHFVPTLSRQLPLEYVLWTDSSVIALLRLHGIRVDTADAQPAMLEAFAVDSLVRSPRAFQGHHELRVWGRWAESLVPRPKLLIVRTSQPLGRLAAYLLDPESDDSFFTWNLFDATLSRQRLFPVLRRSAP